MLVRLHHFCTSPAPVLEALLPRERVPSSIRWVEPRASSTYGQARPDAARSSAGQAVPPHVRGALPRRALARLHQAANSQAWAAERECELREWQSAREDHDELADPERSEHFHVFLHFSQRIHIKNRRTTQLFDLDGRDGRRLHPEVQAVGATVKDRQRVLAYGHKDGDYEAELENELSAGEEEERDASWGERLNAATTVRGGMQMLMDEFPDIFYALGARMVTALRLHLPDGQERGAAGRHRAPLQVRARERAAPRSCMRLIQ